MRAEEEGQVVVLILAHSGGIQSHATHHTSCICSLLLHDKFPAAPSEGVNLPLLLLVGKYHEFTVAQRARFAPFHNTINAPEAKVIAAAYRQVRLFLRFHTNGTLEVFIQPLFKLKIVRHFDRGDVWVGTIL